MSHLASLWGGTPGVTFESLLGHLASFCVSVVLGARPLHNAKKLLGDFSDVVESHQLQPNNPRILVRNDKSPMAYRKEGCL